MGSCMADSIDYTPFVGDGRQKIAPGLEIPGCENSHISRAQARLIVGQLVNAGRTNHSGAGSTLWVAIEWCQHHKQPYQLKAYPGYGYEVKLLPPL